MKIHKLQKRLGFRTEDHELYSTWKSMKSRCYNKNTNTYHRYGGRGISVCDEWKDNFWQFVDDMEPRPKNHTLDRIDNSGPYSKENCRWATSIEQQSNKVTNLKIIFEGQIYTETELSRKTRIPRTTIQQRRRTWAKTGEEMVYGFK